MERRFGNRFGKNRGNGILKADSAVSRTEIIGVVGTAKGAGTTHLAVLMANYMTGARRKTCALLEWNGHGDFERMERALGRRAVKPVKSVPFENSFRLMNTDYFKNAGTKELLFCIEQEYDRIILDFGCAFHSQRNEFLRCSRKYVVAALSEWQIGGLLEFICEMKAEASYKSWEYGAAFGSEEARREVIKRLKIPLQRIPLSVDPFSWNREIMAYFER